MSQITPLMRDLAQRLIAHEVSGAPSAGGMTPPCFSICLALRPHMVVLMGSTGFRVLLSRALQMASTTDAFLRRVQVTPDGSLEMIVGAKPSADPQAMAKSSEGLVARLFSLLAAFIGDDLTMRIVQETWPKLSPGKPGLGKGKTK